MLSSDRLALTISLLRDSMDLFAIPDTDLFLRLDLEEVDERPVVIAPFIRQGDLVYFTGAPGQGKSTLIADLILAACLPSWVEDRHFLSGAMRVDHLALGHPSRVVLLDAENEPGEWLSLIEAAARARGLDLEHGDLQWALEGVRWRRCRDYAWDDLDALDSEIERLVQSCRELEARFLVIDSLHKMWTKDLNSPDWVTRGLGKLRERCRDEGITTIALVHTSRDFKDKLASNRYLPAYTSQQEKEADTIIGMRRIIKEDLLELQLVKRRAAKWNPEGSKAHVRLSPTHGGYAGLVQAWLFEDPNRRVHDNPAACLSAHHRRTLMSLPSTDTFQYQDLDGPRQKRAALLRPLIDQGMVVIQSGRGVRASPYVFALTEKGRAAISHLRNSPGTVYFSPEGNGSHPSLPDGDG